MENEKKDLLLVDLDETTSVLMYDITLFDKNEFAISFIGLCKVGDGGTRYNSMCKMIANSDNYDFSIITLKDDEGMPYKVAVAFACLDTIRLICDPSLNITDEVIKDLYNLAKNIEEAKKVYLKK